MANEKLRNLDIGYRDVKYLAWGLKCYDFTKEGR